MGAARQATLLEPEPPAEEWTSAAAHINMTALSFSSNFLAIDRGTRT
jgi:hypothetical protein